MHEPLLREPAADNVVAVRRRQSCEAAICPLDVLLARWLPLPPCDYEKVRRFGKTKKHPSPKSPPRCTRAVPANLLEPFSWSTSCACSWTVRNRKMTWKTPRIVELPVGMEINMYACATHRPRNDRA
jgi:coenzyme PQQ precursor peptide PqqA